VKRPRPRFLPLFAACICALASPTLHAGKQQEEALAASVRAAMHQAVSDAPPTLAIENEAERDLWLNEMSLRLEKNIKNIKNPLARKELFSPHARKELLTTIHYEAIRAGLDPQIVLGLIQVESRFNKYAISQVGARGYMQVMPFWVAAIGNREDNLFHMRTNLRYGCTILRHYLDLEKGNLYLALGRYNGSRGKPAYPNRVYAAWQKNWDWKPTLALSKATAANAPAAQQTPPTPIPPAPAAPPPAPSAASAPPLPPTPAPPAPTVSPPPPPPPQQTTPTTPAQIAAQPSETRRDTVIVR
jgi:hypothetical protein